MFAALGSLGVTTYIKIAAVVVLALIIGGLYWYGQHEAGLNTTLTKEVGAQNQVIADDVANINALQAANLNWSNALKKYQKDAQDQAAAYNIALALKEKINAKLAAVEALLRSNPRAAAAGLNALNDQLVCLLNDASGGGARDGCPVAAPVAPAAPAPARP